ncbi:MAG: lysoplasmalogenase family protein [Clostridia bacterium]
MQLYQILFLVVYAVLLFIYFFVEVRQNRTNRIVVKTILAVLYFALAVVGSALNFTRPIIQIAMLVGLVFTLAGDIFLVTTNTKEGLVNGGIIFYVGNIALLATLVYMINIFGVPFTTYSWGLLGCFVLFILIIVAQRLKLISFGNSAWLVVAYLMTISICALLSICIATYRQSVFATLFAVGMTLFMISDYFIVLYNYKWRKKSILICNSASYFAGIFLVALSLGFLL